MGCVDSRENTNEDCQLRKAELSHPFSSIRAETLVKELAFNSRNGIILLSNLQRFCANLKIPFNALTDYQALYRSLTPNGCDFLTDELLLVCVLLGQDTPTMKSQLWFEYVDSEAVGALEVDLVKQSLNELVRVGAELIPLLIPETSFTRELRQFQVNLCHRLGAALTAATVTLKDIQKSLPLSLFDSAGLRTLLISEKSHPYPVNEFTLSTRQSPLVEKNQMFLFEEASDFSDNSSDGVVVTVQLPNQRSKNIIVYQDDDLDEITDQFSSRYSLTNLEKNRFKDTLVNIRHSLGGQN